MRKCKKCLGSIPGHKTSGGQRRRRRRRKKKKKEEAVGGEEEGAPFASRVKVPVGYACTLRNLKDDQRTSANNLGWQQKQDQTFSAESSRYRVRYDNQSHGKPKMLNKYQDDRSYGEKLTKAQHIYCNVLCILSCCENIFLVPSNFFACSLRRLLRVAQPI